MLKTEDTLEVRFGVDWNNIKNSIIMKLKQRFNRHPQYFFTELDVHSSLYSITENELRKHRVLPETTSDGFQITLMHHEYPTPFRCDMEGTRFVLKDKPPYRRGYYDFVILNPEFVKSNVLQVVCGNDYRKFKSAMKKTKAEPLIWACEVVFFPRTKPIPKNANRVIKQDTLKLKETLEYKVGKDVSFCRYASTLVFTNHEAKTARDRKQILKSFK